MFYAYRKRYTRIVLIVSKLPPQTTLYITLRKKAGQAQQFSNIAKPTTKKVAG